MRHFAFILCLMTSLLMMGQLKDYSVKLSDFTEVTVANNINVVYSSVESIDSAGLAVFTCLPEQASSIVFSNDKGKLKLQTTFDLNATGLPTVRIYSQSLSKATNWSDSTLILDGVNPGSKFKAVIINNGSIVARNIQAQKIEGSVKAGNGRIFMTGKAQEAKYSIMGAGSIEAGSVEAAAVTCQMYGTGTIDCDATERLSIVGAGSGTIYYKNNAATIKNHGIGVKAVAVE